MAQPAQQPMEAPQSFVTLDATAITASSSCATLFQWGNGQGVKVLKKNVEQAKTRLKLLSSSDDDEEAMSPRSMVVAKPIAAKATLHAPTVALRPQMIIPAAASSGARDFATPARSTFGGRKPFTAPRLVSTAATALNISSMRSSSTIAPSPAVVAAHVPPSGTKKLLVKLHLDLLQLDGGQLPLLPRSAADLASHTFPLSSCSSALLALLAINTTEEKSVGDSHFHKALHALGAVPVGCSLEWVEHHVKLIKHKLLAHSLYHAASPSGVHYFTPLHVLIQLCYRYNAEYVDGLRSILRRVCEKDSPPSTAMVLFIHAIRQGAVAPHAVAVDLSDGWYVATTILDVPLSQLLKDGVLVEGQKITVCGATSRYETAASPLEIPSGTPLLSVGRNGVSFADPQAKLGVVSRSGIPVMQLQHIHPQGGSVSALDAIVSRVLPPYFVQTISDEGDTPKKTAGDSSGGRSSARHQARIIRSSQAHAKFVEGIERQREIAYEKAIETMSREAAAELLKERFSFDISQVCTMVIENGTGEVAAVQLWLRQGIMSVADDTELPKEGSRVTFFNLAPCRYERCGPPLSCKLLYAQRQLCFIPNETTPHTRELNQTPPLLNFRRRVFSSFSQIINDSQPTRLSLPDMCVVFVGAKVLDAKRLVFLVIGVESNVFGLVDVISIPGIKEIVLPLPTEGSACVLQCLRFISHDDGLEHSVYRFDASEYTSITQRPRNQDAAEALVALEKSRSSWRCTLELGKKLLRDDDTIPRWAARQVGSVGTASSEGSAWHVAPSSTPGTFRGPLYLVQSSQQTKNGQEKLSKSVVASEEGQAPGRSSGSSLGRALFDASPILHPPSQSEVTGSELARSVHRAVNSVHLFCNIVPASGVVQLCASGGVIESYNIFSDEPTNSLRATATADSLSELRTSSLATSRVIFNVDGGPEQASANVAFAGQALEVLCSAATGNMHSLLSVCVDEDHFLLSMSRGNLLGALDSEAEKWGILFSNSVVISKSLLDEKKRELQDLDCSAAAADPLSAGSEPRPRSGKRSEVDADLLSALSRWNDSSVDASRVLWWSDEEWRMVQEQLLAGLQDKLFKLTLSIDGSAQITVDRCYFVKDKCPIGSLFC